MKKLVALILAGVMALSMTACGSKDAETTAAPAETTAAGQETTAAPQETQPAVGEPNAAGTTKPVATTKDSLVIATNMDPGTMDPYAGSFGPQLTFTTQCLESLFIYMNGEAIPWLATGLEYDDNNMGVTIKLREGVKFHNGDEMTAEHVQYSFLKASESAPTATFMGVCLFDKVEVVDDYTVYVPLKYPSGTMADTLTNLFVINKNTYDAEHTAAAGFTGTGPWVVDKWTAGVGCAYKAFEEYWDGAPIIKNLEINIITEASTRMIELENGNVDINKGAAALDIQRVANGESEGLAIWKAAASQAIHFMGFNVSHEPFDDIKVRQAFCHAIDSETLTLAVFENVGEVGTSLVPGNAWYTPTLPEELQYKYDPELAKSLLAEAGYPDGITVQMYCDSNAYRVAMAEILPSMLAKAGITIEIEPMETAAYNEKMLADNEYDLFLRNVGNLSEPSGALRQILPSMNTIGGSGYWRYTEEDEYAAKIDELMSAAGLEPDITKRAAIYQDLCTLWAENALSKPIADFYDTNLVAGNLKGMFYTPNINVQYAYFE